MEEEEASSVSGASSAEEDAEEDAEPLDDIDRVLEELCEMFEE